ncbi:unnamed protein product [Moneuplotes crassus]|uniref:RBR-type E3 ubiquitin transferase n=1 Tax=Euplotes crassus TaxID=5936 RepID=A0AAD2DC03_EUPCR|nr:unnamed protein product [Moneuplotes crassus]
MPANLKEAKRGSAIFCKIHAFIPPEMNASQDSKSDCDSSILASEKPSTNNGGVSPRVFNNSSKTIGHRGTAIFGDSEEVPICKGALISEHKKRETFGAENNLLAKINNETLSRPSFTQRHSIMSLNQKAIKRKSDIKSVISVNEIPEQNYEMFIENQDEVKSNTNLELIEEKKFENESNETNKLFDNLSDIVDYNVHGPVEKSEHLQSSPEKEDVVKSLMAPKSVSIKAKDSLKDTFDDEERKTQEMFGNLSQNVFKSQIIKNITPTDHSVHMTDHSNPKMSSSRKNAGDGSSSATFKGSRTKIREAYSKGMTNLELFYSAQLRSVYNKHKYKANYQIKQSPGKKDLIIKLYEMGFQDDCVERAFLYADVACIEEIISYLIPNEKGFWDHKFFPESQSSAGGKCLLCRRSQPKKKPMKNHQKKTSSEIRLKNQDLEIGSPVKKEKKLELEISQDNKRIKNNIQMIKFREFINLQDNPYEPIFRDKTVMNHSEDDQLLSKSFQGNITNNKKNKERNILAKFEEDPDFEINESGDLGNRVLGIEEFGRREGDRGVRGEKEDDSWGMGGIPELQRKRLANKKSHSSKEAVTAMKKNPLRVQEEVKLPTIIGVEGDEDKSYLSNNLELERSRSAKSLFFPKNLEGHTVREFEDDELCAICLQPYELHSFDHNLELMALAQKYCEIIEQASKEGNDSFALNHTHMSVISYGSKIRIPGNEEGTLDSQTIVKMKSKSRKLTENINLEETLSNNKASVSDLTKSKEESSQAFHDEIRQTHRLMIDRALAHLEKEHPELCRGNINGDKCQICLCESDKPVPLNCNHTFCKECLNEYLRQKIKDSQVFDIKCPITKCRTPIDRNIVIHSISKQSRKVYKRFTKTLAVIRDQPNFVFCIECNRLNQLRGDDLLAQCRSCDAEMCIDCVKPWHEGIPCHEELEVKYNEYAQGKNIQLCPKCGSFMEKAAQCNHLTCTRCMSKFCIYCRQEFSEDHLNPLNSQACPSLVNNQKVRPVFNSPFMNASSCKLITVLVTYVCIMPLVLVVCWPVLCCKSLKSRRPPAMRKRRIRVKTPSCIVLAIGAFLGLLLLPVALCRVIRMNNRNRTKSRQDKYKA